MCGKYSLIKFANFLTARKVYCKKACRRFLVLFHEKCLFQMLPDEEENTSYFTLSVEVSKNKSGKDEGALVWYNQMNQSPLPGDFNTRKGT
jgi:hypothetical protein